MELRRKVVLVGFSLWKKAFFEQSLGKGLVLELILRVGIYLYMVQCTVSRFLCSNHVASTLLIFLLLFIIITHAILFYNYNYY